MPARRTRPARAGRRGRGTRQGSAPAPWPPRGEGRGRGRPRSGKATPWPPGSGSSGPNDGALGRSRSSRSKAEPSTEPSARRPPRRRRARRHRRPPPRATGSPARCPPPISAEYVDAADHDRPVSGGSTARDHAGLTPARCRRRRSGPRTATRSNPRSASGASASAVRLSFVGDYSDDGRLRSAVAAGGRRRPGRAHHRGGGASGENLGYDQHPAAVHHQAQILAARADLDVEGLRRR